MLCNFCNREIHKPRSDQRFCNRECRKSFAEHHAKSLMLDKDFGSWHVVSFIKKKGKESYWLCRCDCGKERVQKRSTLTSGNSTQCMSCAQRNRDEFPFFIYSKIRENAKKRKIDFDVTQSYLYDLFLSQERRCSFTGWQISFATNVISHSHRGSTASLDRIDSALGYVEGNVRWVHKHINWMKRDHDDPYFLQLCESVTKFAKEGNNVRSSEISHVGKDGGKSD